MLSWFQANDKYLSCPRTISKHQKWTPGCILSQIDTLHRPLGRKPNFLGGSYWWSGAQSQIHRITLYFAWQTVWLKNALQIIRVPLGVSFKCTMIWKYVMLKKYFAKKSRPEKVTFCCHVSMKKLIQVWNLDWLLHADMTKKVTS